MPAAISAGKPASDHAGPGVAGLRDSWLDARDEWGREVHQPGSGLHQDDEVETETGFCA